MFRSSAKPLSGRYLSLAEREEIALLNAQGHSIREIGRRLGRAGSTISRELDRNAATHGGQNGLSGDGPLSGTQIDRPRRPKADQALRSTPPCAVYVEERLAGVVAPPSGSRVRGRAIRWKDRRPALCQDRRWTKAWSPEQIARRLPIDFPDDDTMRISHEAIYQALFVQGRGTLGRELTACLRNRTRVTNAQGRARASEAKALYRQRS